MLSVLTIMRYHCKQQVGSVVCGFIMGPVCAQLQSWQCA